MWVMGKKFSPLLIANAVFVILNIWLLFTPDQRGENVVAGSQNTISPWERKVRGRTLYSNKNLQPKKEYGGDLPNMNNQLPTAPVFNTSPNKAAQTVSVEELKPQKLDLGLDKLVAQTKEEPEVTPTPAKSSMTRLTKSDYARIRPFYSVPSLDPVTVINCSAVLHGDPKELQKAQEHMTQHPKVPIYEETFLEWTQDCDAYKLSRGFIQIPLTEEEENFPLAFSISMYRDVEQAERLLRAIYQPQNIYCIHIDTKSSLLIHRTMQALVNCFDNVFIASKLDKVKWGDVSVLLPAINCMRDLVTYHRGKWKYFINLTGQEYPLRTNYELVRIAKIFNGSNDIAGSMKRMDQDRVKYKWTHRWSKTYQQTIFYNTFQPKSPPPYNLTTFKGELHGFFSRKMVEFVVESPIAQEYLRWCWDTGHPSEHYWNTLNYNTHIKAPGRYDGPLELANIYSQSPAIRAKHWQDLNYGSRKCQGQQVRGICVFAVGDLPWLNQRHELFVNKFYLTYQYLALDCMEEKHHKKLVLKDKVPLDEYYFRGIPTVKYGVKDGL